jgi:hypothetical protein
MVERGAVWDLVVKIEKQLATLGAEATAAANASLPEDGEHIPLESVQLIDMTSSAELHHLVGLLAVEPDCLRLFVAEAIHLGLVFGHADTRELVLAGAASASGSMALASACREESGDDRFMRSAAAGFDARSQQYLATFSELPLYVAYTMLARRLDAALDDAEYHSPFTVFAAVLAAATGATVAAAFEALAQNLGEGGHFSKNRPAR